MSDYDPTDFVDNDFQERKTPHPAVASGGGFSQRAPTREEVDTRVVEAQQKLAELKRAQEDLERERATLEETRRRQMEFQTGRQELVESLTRGLGLLEEAEFNARRDSEQMAKALADLKDALSKLQAIHEAAWTKDNFNVELTRGLTTIENARMEWNSARLRFPLLAGGKPDGDEAGRPETAPAEASPFGSQSFGQWCKIGLALTWPVALAVLLALGAAMALFGRR